MVIQIKETFIVQPSCKHTIMLIYKWCKFN